MRRLNHKTALTVAGFAAAIAIGVPLALAASDSGSVRVIAPEDAVPASINPETQTGGGTTPPPASPTDPHAAIPAPVGPPPSIDGKPPHFGEPIADPANPPKTDIALPVPAAGATVRDAQVNNTPVDTTKAPGGIGFTIRYYAVYTQGGVDYQVTVTQPSTGARSIGLTLGSSTTKLSDGTPVYSGPGENTSMLHAGTIVTVSGASDAQRQEFLAQLAFD
jgi:hypothetical protein